MELDRGSAMEMYGDQAARVLLDSSEEMRADEEVVRAAVAHDGRALQHASEELRSSKAIVLIELGLWLETEFAAGDCVAGKNVFHSGFAEGQCWGEDHDCSLSLSARNLSWGEYAKIKK
jgi:hypothetical protein